MTTFIDTNIIVYLLQESSPFHDWAKNAVANADPPIIASDIVYSELSIGMADIAETDAAISNLAIERLPFSNDALFLAGRAYKKHCENGGSKSNVLSDFLIGAQAQAEEAPLLTNDVKNYKSYFPAVVLIKPPKVT